MSKLKKLIPTIALLLSCFFSFAYEKSTLLSDFLQKHRMLENIKCRMENLKKHGEPNQNVCDMFSVHLAPLLETTQKINRIILEQNYKMDDRIMASMIHFEDAFTAYEELVRLIDLFLLQVEKIYLFESP
ncbi:hypothetical protein ACFLX2_00790 [Candidatus Dependentiae bacterium]